MDKINFKVSGQSLMKTGGLSTYASDAVEYIQAEFTLSDEWKEYDSVRAVWQNGDIVAPPSVLDSEGKCLVPFEVLTERGRVTVNLVGSSANGIILTKRITSYIVTAFMVTVKVNVNGSDPQTITPSQFEQFVANVANDANRAETGASNAESEAENALASAQASEASALRASGHAQNAQSAETSARAYAQNAQNYATDAENAKDDAIDARDEIRSMRANAETLEPNQSATASYSNGVLTLGIPKGQKGDTGDTGSSAGFGTVSASVDDSTGTPSVEVTTSGTDTAKNFAFAFHNLKGAKGDKGDDGTVPDLDLILPTDTASGDIASITDGQNVVPVKSLKVTLEPIQSGSGTPSPDNVRPISGHTECVTWDDPVYGGTIEWNQLVPSDTPSSSAVTNNGDGSFTAIAGANEYYIIGRFNVEQGHKYLASCRGGDATSCYLRVDGADGNPWIREASSAHIYTAGFSGEQKPIYIRTFQPSQNITVVPQLSDLTQMFGAGNEPTTVDEFKALFPLDDYAYNTGEKTCVSAVNGTEYYTYTTTLGRTVYGGTLDVVSGELVVDRAMVDLSTLNFNYDSSGQRWQRTMPDIYNYSSRNGNLVSEKYVADTTASAGSEGKMFTVGKGLYIYSTDGTTPPSGNLVYPLATPQTYQLDPQTISLLHGNNNVWSDGSVEVTYNADVQLWVEKQLI